MGKQRERNAIPSSDRFPHGDANNDSSKQRFAIRLAFDGTTYNGFQSQPDKNTIQDQIENRLQSLLRRPVRITAWGRTDTGVHAKGADVTVDLSLDEVYKFAKQKSGRNTTSSSISCKEEGDESAKKQTAVNATAKFLHSVLIQFACNHPLPQSRTPASQSRYGSISALAVKPVSLDFDARYSCLWKRYVYYICATSSNNEVNGYTDDDQTLSPFVWNRYAWIIRQSLDLDKMMKAAELLGSKEHNFECMVVMQVGELRDTLRKIKLFVETVNTSFDSGGDTPYFLQQSGNNVVYKISVESDFFLYKMVRRIVGILVAIGKNEASLDELRVCLEEHDKRYHDVDQTTNQKKIKVPTTLLQTAPAKGLCLDHIEYEIPI